MSASTSGYCSMTMNLRQALAQTLTAGSRTQHRNVPLVRLFAAIRALRFRELVPRIERLGYFEDFFADPTEVDPFFFLTHKYYLARSLSVRQRVEAAIHHYESERAVWNHNYLSAVYQGPGLALWSESSPGGQVELTLVGTEDNRYEGDLSVVLSVDAAYLARMSFSVVDGHLFGLPSQPVVFVTRNQVTRKNALAVYRRVFPQMAPAYLCLSAVTGISVARGATFLAAIRRVEQIAYNSLQDEGFANSYCRFWNHFTPESLGPLAYLLTLPLQVTPIAELPRSKRRRARGRRALRQTIFTSAWHAVTSHLRHEPLGSAPEPGSTDDLGGVSVA